MKSFRYTIVFRNGLFWVLDTKTNKDVTFFSTWEKAKDYCDGRN